MLEFIDYYKQWIDLDHPYVTCISEKTCNGTFLLGMGASIEENKTQIENFLNKCGEVERISTFDYYSITFNTDNLYRIGPILNSSLFSDVVLYAVWSDYKLESLGEDFYYCEIDEDCVKISPVGCIKEVHFINKKYKEKVEAYYKIKNFGVGCVAVESPPSIRIFYEPKCFDNKCNGVFSKSLMCDSLSDFLESIEEEFENETYFSDSNMTYRDMKDICGN